MVLAGAAIVAACGDDGPEERVVDYEGVPTVDELEAAGPDGLQRSVPSDATTTTAPSDDSVDDPEQLLRRAIALTEVVTSGRFEVTEHLDGYGLAAEPMIFEGAFDADLDLVGVRSDVAVALTPYGLPGMAADDVGIDVEMVGEEGVTYVSGVAYGLRPDRWVRVSGDARLSDHADQLQAAARAVAALQPHLEYVGAANLAGDETTWFDATLDASTLDAAQLAALDEVIWEMALVEDDDVAIEIDVHVGEDALLRQVRWYVDGIDLNPLVGLWERGRFESTVAYHDLGVPVDIRVPSEHEITDDTELAPPPELAPEAA